MLILLGFGLTNQAIARKFSPCFIFDDNFKEESQDCFGNTLLPPCRLLEVLEKYPNVKVVTSPGIPPNNPLITASHPMSEYDFFSHCMPFSVWISGTNGKSTTTEMLTFLLAYKGAISGGNIGKPLADLPLNASIWVLETSSFTLHYTHRAKPNLYLLLPISEDHISWHSSYEDYIKDKLKPLLCLRDKEIAILPKMFENHSYAKNSLATLIFYEDSQSLAETFGIDTQRIVFKEPFLLDSLLALSATKILFDILDYDLLNTFKIGAHKIEEFYDSSHRLWVDDSKGTNVEATLEAIKCYEDKPLYLILGGDDKGADLTPLFVAMEDLEVSLYAIGSNAEKIASLAKRYQKPCVLCHTLENAVNAIKQNHNLQSVAMLSPAAASLDQFSSYKQRGERFKAYVLK
ncbi:UDP-N-acetylmuramoyl-L-alanine--D-glutamate ligase [Helicobacter apodemus]|uniref:UDP-N-acetylmuramoyl-L-alanine--D-glutamate ligase n=1 Tax=Helicobacter apodemus TaxID=135569 RepID=A0A4U8UJP1_9HELI|nr:UDP-N-acetylmuramoyl-L-alanine--D-glutamate ligase [Helicobacter apodemus]TLE16587.1 UDP-N-acetylmuramoyl-L-alanine--D-glutamate ligase [Helicobacter apodemus]